jgi:hypothetical protein
MSTENCDVHIELLCVQGPVMLTGTVISTENFDMHREFICDVYRNCDVYREL